MLINKKMMHSKINKRTKMLVKKATMTKITYRYFNYTHYINTIKSSSSNKNNN